jgi:hypothetical protein
MNATISQCSGICAALAALVCSLGGCGSGAKTPIVDALSRSVEAGGPGVEASVDSGTIDAPTCPASCDDKNDCTTDSCDPNTFQCVHTNVDDGTSCEDGSPCTINDICKGGLCYSGPNKTCTPTDQCHEAGNCSPRTGECSNPNSQNGKSCDDGLKCTTGDQCQAGVCQGIPFCPSFATCDPATGFCHGPNGESAFPAALSEQLFENASGPTNSNGLVRAPDGQIFVAGTFHNTTNLGNGPVTTVSPTDMNNTAIFLAKLDPSTDKASWSQVFFGSQAQGIGGVATNGTGQLGLMGTLTGDITVGDTTLEQSSSAAWYILGASATDGRGQWARQVSVSTTSSKSQPTGLSGIAGDPQGATFVLCGTVNQAGTDLSPSLQGKAQWQGGTDVVLAGLDGATGDTLWAAQVGGNNDEACAGVAMDGQSNTYVVGSYRFASVVRLGDLGPLPTVNDPKVVAMFVAKLGGQRPFGVADAGAEDSSGAADAGEQESSSLLNALWAVSFAEGTQGIVPLMLALGSDLVLVGTIPSGGAVMGGVDLSASDIFVAKLDGHLGSPVWVKRIGNSAKVALTALAERANGGLLLTGSYSEAFTIGTLSLPAAANGQGTFVAELDSDGDVLAAKGYGGPFSKNMALGVIGRTGGTDAENGSLLMLQFQGGLDLGLPIGSISASTPTTPTVCITTLAP